MRPTRVRQLIGLAILVLAAKGASAQILPYGYQSPRSASPAAVQSGPSERIHPAVVRVIATGGVGTASLGSGALVAVTEQHGLVVTNWHVVRDAVGPIYVAFADGFRSGATVLRTDRNWDLAALAIWRPNVAPILLANEAPRPGEVLTIAGYGGGQYRTMTGQCTQYVAPGRNQPFEMVELSVPAHQGDSGGPILNGRGELAGVLFGTTGTTTTGSYCGRVRWFLNPVIDDFHGMQPSAIQIAQQRGGAVMPVEQGRSSQSAAGRGVVESLPHGAPAPAERLAGCGRTDPRRRPCRHPWSCRRHGGGESHHAAPGGGNTGRGWRPRLAPSDASGRRAVALRRRGGARRSDRRAECGGCTDIGGDQSLGVPA